MNLLFVTDSKLLERILYDSLSAWEVDACFCSSVKDTLIKVKQKHFEFIAVSGQLIDGNGIELVTRLRALEGYHHSPIVLITAESSPELHIKALRAGATDIFLSQNIEELITFITRLLSHESKFDASILYVEDSAAQAMPMISILKSHGLSVDWFTTAEQALEAVHNKVYDVILTDIVLNSAMQGTMFVTHIRRMNGNVGDVPIVAITAYDQVESRIALFQIGIDDYVSKPVIEAELIPRIFRLVERQRLMLKMKLQEEAAQRYNQAKSDFLAQMSHEIRTPLAGIAGSAELLERTHLDSQQQHLVSLLIESSKAALTILNDILDLSKIEAGKLEIESIPMNLREVIEAAIRLVLTAVQSKRITLTLFISPDLPKIIMSDPTRLQQIVLNLLSNAVKFTGNSDDRPGLIRVHVEPSNASSDRPAIKICIVDNGIGISADAQKHLFNAFEQAEESTYRKFGGTGLGLNIVKALAEMMGGQIKVTSELNQGSEFCLQLPLMLPNTNGDESARPLKDIWVAVVSKHDECARVLVAYAKEAGARVAVETCLENALARLNHVSGSKVLVIDVEELQVHVVDKIQDIGIVEMMGREGSQRLAHAIGVPARPLFFGAYIDAIKSAAQRHQIAPVQDSAAMSIQNGFRHHVLIAEDNLINQELFKAQFDLLGVECVIAGDGSQALALWRQNRFGLILTDCDMPNMNGYELTAHIRAEEYADHRTAIIAITANALKGEAEQCLAHGMDDYITKPISLDGLNKLLQKWIKI